MEPAKAKFIAAAIRKEFDDFMASGAVLPAEPGAAPAHEPLALNNSEAKGSGLGFTAGGMRGSQVSVAAAAVDEAYIRGQLQEIGSKIANIKERLEREEWLIRQGKKESELAPILAEGAALAGRFDEIRSWRNYRGLDAELLLQISMIEDYLIVARVNGDKRVASLVDMINDKKKKFYDGLEKELGRDPNILWDYLEDSEIAKKHKKEMPEQEYRKYLYEKIGVGVSKLVRRDLNRLTMVRNRVARELGYKNYAELMLEPFGLKPRDVIRLVRQKEKETRAEYKECMLRRDKFYREQYGLEKVYYYDSSLPQGDFEKAFRGYLSDKDSILEFVELLCKRLGLIEQNSSIAQDENLEFAYKGRQPVTFPWEPGRKAGVGVLIPFGKATAGLNVARNVAHETAHALQYRNVNPDLEDIKRYADCLFNPNIAIAEGFAEYVVAALMEPEFLSEFLQDKMQKELDRPLLPEERDKLNVMVEDARQQYRGVYLESLRRSCALTEFEITMYLAKKPSVKRFMGGYNRIWRRHMRPPRYDKTNYGRDYARIPHFIDNAMYYQNYVIMYSIAEELRRVAKEKFGSVISKDAGPWFKEDLFWSGGSAPFRERLAEMGVSLEGIVPQAAEDEAHEGGMLGTVSTETEEIKGSTLVIIDDAGIEKDIIQAMRDEYGFKEGQLDSITVTKGTIQDKLKILEALGKKYNTVILYMNNEIKKLSIQNVLRGIKYQDLSSNTNDELKRAIIESL